MSAPQLAAAHLFGLPAPAAQAHTCLAARIQGLSPPPMCASIPLHDGTGRILDVDPRRGWLRLQHTALGDYLPAGEAEFRVTPRTLVRDLDVGDEVNFTVEGVTGALIGIGDDAVAPESPSSRPSADRARANRPAPAAPPAPYPKRQRSVPLRAHQPIPHIAVARSCAEPKGLRTITVQAGRGVATPGESFSFLPSLLYASPCEEVEIILENQDHIRHSLMLPGLSPMFHLETLGPGTVRGRFVTPPEDVTLAFHCHVPQHEKMGMLGWLIVGQGGEGAPTARSEIRRYYDATGTVLSTDRRQSLLVVDHEEIPGLMAAMVMGLKVEPAELLGGLTPGSRIGFTLDTLAQRVTGIRRSPGSAVPAPAESARVTGEPTGPQERTRGQPGATVEGRGVVVAILVERRQIVLDHEDIPGFMSAMTMGFSVADLAWLEGVEVGQRVRFEVDRRSAEIVAIEAITQLTKPLAAPPDERPEAAVTGVSADAVTLGRDLDGDGDPDEVHFRLEVVEREEEVWPGELLNVWVFAPLGEGMVDRARLPSPTLRVEQGDRVKVTLHNTHYLPHTIHLHGTIHPNEMDGVPGFTQRPVMPGEAFTYEFVAVNPGTHSYHCHVQPDVHVLMGLMGMLVIEPDRPGNHFSHLVIGAGEMPELGVATAAAYDREYSLVYMDMDDRLNRVPLSERDPRTISRRMHREYDSTQRRPGIFMLNGRSFPFTLRDTPVRIAPGERVKLRVLNAGARTVHLHTHGHRGRVTHRDGNPLPAGAQYLRDVFSLGAAQRLDIELRPGADETYSSGPGVWLMHDHTEHAVTNKGIHPGGDLTVLVYPGFLDASGGTGQAALQIR